MPCLTYQHIDGFLGGNPKNTKHKSQWVSPYIYTLRQKSRTGPHKGYIIETEFKRHWKKCVYGLQAPSKFYCWPFSRLNSHQLMQSKIYTLNQCECVCNNRLYSNTQALKMFNTIPSVKAPRDVVLYLFKLSF